MKKLLNESFTTADGDLEFDAYLPDDPIGSVICIHGGGWISGDKSEMRDVAAIFAHKGLAAFCPQYRLAPLHPYPAAVKDVRAFVKHLRENAEGFGVKPHKIAAFGNSAGGYLCAMSAVSPDPSSRPNVCADVCGLADLTRPQQQHPSIAWDFIGQYMRVPYDGNEEIWIAASPVYLVDAGTAPTIIFHGDQDDIVWPEQSKKLHEAFQINNVESRLHLLPNEGHSFTLPAFEEILDRSSQFFQEHFVK